MTTKNRWIRLLAVATALSMITLAGCGDDDAETTTVAPTTTEAPTTTSTPPDPPPAPVGGLTVGILESLVGGYIDPKFSEITPYVILLLVLLFRPEGLFGLKRIERI